MKVVLITNIPAPYREKIYEIISDNKDIDFTVIYNADIEKDREWEFELGKYKKYFLNSNKISFKNRTVYLWSNIYSLLNKIIPDIVITAGFSVPYLQSIIWTKMKGKKQISFTDGWSLSEKNLSIIHKILRKIVFVHSAAYIGASNKSMEMYKEYGVRNIELFQSNLCIDNKYYFDSAPQKKKYDLMFSGQFIERKMPMFFVKVCKSLKEQVDNLKVLIIGNGPLKNQIIRALEINNVDFDYPGFIKQIDLPQYYKQSRIFLFPTKVDPWGV